VPFHPKEERFEGLVYPSKNVLAATKVRKPEVPCGSNILQLVRLGVVVDRDPLFPSIATFLQRTVVESAGFAKLPVECFQLGAIVNSRYLNVLRIASFLLAMYRLTVASETVPMLPT